MRPIRRFRPGTLGTTHWRARGLTVALLAMEHRITFVSNVIRLSDELHGRFGRSPTDGTRHGLETFGEGIIT